MKAAKMGKLGGSAAASFGRGSDVHEFTKARDLAADKKADKATSQDALVPQVRYKYQAGFTNAVRRPVTISRTESRRNSGGGGAQRISITFAPAATTSASASTFPERINFMASEARPVGATRASLRARASPAGASSDARTASPPTFADLCSSPALAAAPATSFADVVCDVRALNADGDGAK